MKRLLITFLVLILIICIVGIGYVMLAEDIPSNSDEIIQKASSMDLPNYYKGTAGVATNGDIDIWYELNKSTIPKKGTVLLIMGYGSTSMQWPGYFFEPFQDAGYDVIRFDHRDIGKSTWLTNWDADNPYTLEDLAKDALAILDKENIEKAHIAGMSMGGMVAQSFAIHHPERTLSLSSISSSAFFGDEDLPGIWPETVKAIARYTIKYSMNNSSENDYKFNLTASNLFKGNYELDNINTVLKARYEIEKRNGINPDAGTHHEAAITVSGSRYDKLKDVTVPSLVIHGKSDPLVNFAHGEKTADLLPNAKTLYLDDLGHDIPEHLAGEMSASMIDLFESVAYHETSEELAIQTIEE